MSISPVDMQVMITKTTEVAGKHSAELHKAVADQQKVVDQETQRHLHKLPCSVFYLHPNFSLCFLFQTNILNIKIGKVASLISFAKILLDLKASCQPVTEKLTFWHTSILHKEA